MICSQADNKELGRQVSQLRNTMGEMKEPMAPRRHILVDAVVNIFYFIGYVLVLHVIGMYVFFLKSHKVDQTSLGPDLYLYILYIGLHLVCFKYL